MKTMQKLVLGSAIVGVAFSVFALTTGAQAARRLRSGKRVVIDCGPGWRAGAGGSYGGVSFDVGCFNGKGQATIDGPVGTAFSIRMGVESSSVGADCAFNGDSPSVSVSCAGVGLSIQ